MGKFLSSKCKVCRREGSKLFLKGDRCFSPKCAVDKKKTIPGSGVMKKRPAGKLSEYGKQLREKQRIKKIYGLLERQFRRFFSKATRRAGKTGENLLIMLEMRLDNVIYRLKFSQSRTQARQFVSHGHFKVNGKNVNIPSYIVKVGDEISLCETSKMKEKIMFFFGSSGATVPDWLEVFPDVVKGKVKQIPVRSMIDLSVNEQLVVELYSK